MWRSFLRANSVLFLPRRSVQALYVNSKTMKGNLRIITPMLDFESRFANLTEIKENLRRRELLSSTNVEDLVAQWEIYSTIMSKKEQIESQQKEVSKLLKEAKKANSLKNNLKDTIRKYTLELETLQKDLHNLDENFADVDKRFVDKFLALPNQLSDLTQQELQIISSFGAKIDEKRKSHLEYEDSIDYHNESVYYLKGDAAKFDFTFANECVNHFRKNGLVQFSNPDFANTVLVEGAGLSVDDVFEVSHHYNEHHTNLVHLVGSSSMISFLGFITNLRVHGTLLPLQWVSIGKTYSRQCKDDFGLYNVCQSNTVQTFHVGTKDEIMQIFEDTLQLMEELFKQLNIHFRTVYVPAKELHSSECLAARIEMYSPHLQKYIDVANLRNYSDYISKRLLFTYVKDKKNNTIDFPHIVSGTCNLTRTLAIILETHNGIVPKD